MTDKPDGKRRIAWLDIGELPLVFSIFSGFGEIFSHSVDSTSSSVVTMTIGGSAGIAGCLSWAMLCLHHKWRRHLNWMLAGAGAGILGYPVFALMSFLGWRDIPFNAVPLIALLGFLFWGLVTVPLGICAAAVCARCWQCYLRASRATN